MMLELLIVLFALGLIVPLAGDRFGVRISPWAGLAAFLVFAVMGAQVLGGAPRIQEVGWIPELNMMLRLRLDGLSLLFCLIITGIGALVLWYAGAYLKEDPKRGRFLGVLLLFMASMLGVVLSDQVMALFVFWELTSFTSYLLIGHHHEEAAARRAALQALLVTVGGGLFLLAGLLVIGMHYDTYQLSAWVQAATSGTSAPPLPAVLCVLIGAWTKSAHMPFHFWLPNAMQAPSPASAYLHSSTMVKAGVYLIMRLHPALSVHPAWSPLVMWMGALTFLGCGVMALGQTDLKRLLAYTTAAALGSMTLMTGIGTEKAAVAAVLLLGAHALYKATLFFSAGILAHETGERDARKLGGLASHLPCTCAGSVLAALSMAGLPPFFGFIAKESAYAGGGSWVLTLISVAASAAFVVVAVVAGIGPWTGRLKETPSPPHEAPMAMWAAPVILGGLGLFLGLMPGRVSPLLEQAAAAVHPGLHPIHLSLWHGFNLELLLSILTLGLGAVLWSRRSSLVALGTLARRRATPFGPDRLYDRIFTGILKGAEIQTGVLQNGSLRRYILFILGFTLFLAVICAIRFAEVIPAFEFDPFRVEDLFITVMVLTGAISATLSKSRLTAILSLGVVGYGVALIFIMYGAPDLAMTQFIVESLTVVLLALAFYHLPRFRPRTQYWEKSRDLVFSACVGLVAGGLTLIANRAEYAEPISSFFLENSWTQAHGKNVVNVILVDFRALDTLGEITVLTVAGLGAYALLKLIIHVKEDASS